MRIWRITVLAVLAVLAPPALRAQTTTVTGTVVDPNGNPYASGTASAFRVVPTGQNPGTPVNVSTNGSGSFTMVVPSPASYQFTVCAPPVNIGPRVNPTPTQVCFSSGPISVSGGSLDVTSSLPVAPLLGPVPGGGTSVPTLTVGTLPASPAANTLSVVTDGKGVSCTNGGGSVRVLCQFNGSSWSVVSAQTVQVTTDVAFGGGTIPTGTTGTVVFLNAPASFTFTGASCGACDGQRLNFFVFPSGGPYSIAGTLGSTVFQVPIFGPADKLTFPAGGAEAIFEYRNGTLFMLSGGGFIPSYNGVAGPMVATTDFYQNVTADGPINLNPNPTTPYGSAFVTKGSAAAITLTNPVAGADDGKTLAVISTTAFAHTVTTGANGINGSASVATFGATVGSFIKLKAFNGSWWVIGSVGVNFDGSGPKNIFYACGTTSTCSKTPQTGLITVVGGPIALAIGTLTVTSLPYASSTSYVCSPDDSTGINGVDVIYNSGSSVTFNGTGTDTIRYSCVGN